MKHDRFWELDTFRGLAIILMVVYHVLFDLNFFGIKSFNVNSGILKIMARSSASLFIFLIGVSLTISHSKKRVFSKFFLRGLKIFFYGLIITLVTFIFIGDGFVIFGILQFIGLSIMISYPLVKRPRASLILSGLILLVWGFIKNLRFDFNQLLWLGLVPKSFNSLDYFPLIPWFSIVLLGVFFGIKLYPSGKRVFGLKDYSNNFLIRVLSFLGRKSLFIYFIHQPLIILSLLAMGFKLI